jgi:hypothetical protein
MRIVLRTLLALALLPALAGAGDEGWTPKKDDSGIQMFTRPVEGWTIHEIRGVTRVKARLSSVAAIIHDVGMALELNDMVTESRVVDRQGETRYRTYAAMDMPWPVEDRDMVNQRAITQDPKTLAVKFEDVAIEDGVPRREGYERMVRSRQTWTLTPTPDGAVEVELRVLADPAGPIPSSVVNALSISAPFNTLSRLQPIAERPKFADAKLSFIKDPSARVRKTGEAP